MPRILLAAAAVFSLLCDTAIAGGGAGADADSKGFTVWVTEQTTGGVSVPRGTTCEAWFIVLSGVGFEMYMELDGVGYDLYRRFCTDGEQTVWVPRVPPVDVARAAYASVQRSVAEPRIDFSPPQPGGGIVGVATWLAVEPQPEVTGTAALPALSATATAHVTAIEWRTGTTVSGDVGLISCAPWGSAQGPECAWTPTYPSVPRVTGTADEQYHGSVTLVWEVSWLASDGSSGTFDDLRTTTDYEYAVSEVQAIGERGG